MVGDFEDITMITMMIHFYQSVISLVLFMIYLQWTYSKNN